MKQIIVVSDHREKFENAFSNMDIQATWCGLSVEELIKVRGRSNIIFVCMDHDDSKTIEKIGLFLRDICIEDEKMLYIYGSKENVDALSSFVPKLFISKTVYSFVDLSRTVEELIGDVNESDSGKPCFLLIDNDSEYSEKLRVYLDPYYKFMLCHFDVEDIARMVPFAQIAIISLEGKMTISQLMELFRMFAAKKRNSNFKYYYLAKDDKERSLMNAGSEKTAISFSKEMDVERIARYFIDLVKPKKES